MLLYFHSDFVLLLDELLDLLRAVKTILKMHLWMNWRSLLTTMGQQSSRGFLYCWCIFEELHCDAQLQFFDTHGCFLLCVHFSISCNNCNRTSGTRTVSNSAEFSIFLTQQVH